MLPFFEQPSFHFGPLTVYAFGVAVACAVWVGLTMVHRRLILSGLDLATGQRLGGWILVGGFLGAHLFAVLLYVPQKLAADPWLLLRVWDELSSFGGMLGGLVGGALFFYQPRYRAERPHLLAYLDAFAFSFPAALAIGRLGCTLAHDHPGVITTAPLAFSLKSDAAFGYLSGVYANAGLHFPVEARTMGFHDLGLYEFLFLALVLAPAFRYWDRRPRATGFYVCTFAALYLPVRFGLDVLRIADVRYLGLTPAQWVSALILAALPVAVWYGRKRRAAVSAVLLLVAACACWGGA